MHMCVCVEICVSACVRVNVGIRVRRIMYVIVQRTMYNLRTTYIIHGHASMRVYVNTVGECVEGLLHT